MELRAGRKGGWKEWAGGGREASSDNCVWVQANMRQLPGGPSSLAFSGCKAGRLVTVSFSSRDAEDQGRRRGAADLLNSGNVGLRCWS